MPTSKCEFTLFSECQCACSRSPFRSEKYYLPKSTGLTLDAATGNISGTVADVFRGWVFIGWGPEPALSGTTRALYFILLPQTVMPPQVKGGRASMFPNQGWEGGWRVRIEFEFRTVPGEQGYLIDDATPNPLLGENPRLPPITTTTTNVDAHIFELVILDTEGFTLNSAWHTVQGGFGTPDQLLLLDDGTVCLDGPRLDDWCITATSATRNFSVTTIYSSTSQAVAASAPQSISSCEVLFVSARASGFEGVNRSIAPLYIEWRVESVSPADEPAEQELQLYLDSLEAAQRWDLAIPAADLPGRTEARVYELVAVVRSWMGEMANASVAVERRPFPVPTLSVPAPASAPMAGQAVTLEPLFEVPECTEILDYYSFAWTTADGFSPPTPSTQQMFQQRAAFLSEILYDTSPGSRASKRTLTLPGNMLSPHYPHVLTLQASPPKGDPLLKAATASVTIKAVSSPLRPRIFGAARGLMTVRPNPTTTFTMDGSLSRDPDKQQPSDTPYQVTQTHTLSTLSTLSTHTTHTHTTHMHTTLSVTGHPSLTRLLDPLPDSGCAKSTMWNSPSPRPRPPPLHRPPHGETKLYPQ